VDRARAEDPGAGLPRGAERTEWGLNVKTWASAGLWMNLGAVHPRSLWAATPSIPRRNRSPFWVEMNWLQDRGFRRPCVAVLMTVPCALADGAGAPSRVLVCWRHDRTQQGQVRKLTRSRSNSVYRAPLLRSSGKKDFPAAWLEALRYRPECNQTVGWLPECGRTRIETVNVT